MAIERDYGSFDHAVGAGDQSPIPAPLAGWLLIAHEGEPRRFPVSIAILIWFVVLVMLGALAWKG